jgi:hypothetical protein
LPSRQTGGPEDGSSHTRPLQSLFLYELGLHGVFALASQSYSRAACLAPNGADRMGPGSHPEPIDREIERFLAQQQASWHCDPEPTAAFGRPVFRCRDRLWERPEAVSL